MIATVYILVRGEKGSSSPTTSPASDVICLDDRHSDLGEMKSLLVSCWCDLT